MVGFLVTKIQLARGGLGKILSSYPKEKEIHFVEIK